MTRKILIALTLLMSIGVASSDLVYGAPVVRQEVAVSEPALAARRGVIEIACPSDGKTYTFQIYSITGQLIKRVQLCDSKASIDVAKGCYVVRCEAWVKKIVVG